MKKKLFGGGKTGTISGKYLLMFDQDAYGVWKSNDYAVSWTQVSSGIFTYSTAISMSGQYQFASYNGNLFGRSTDYGENWTITDSSGSFGVAVSMLCSKADDSILFCITGTQIYKSIDYGQTFDLKYTISDGRQHSYYRADMSFDGQYVFIAPFSTGSKLRISSDFGETWGTTNFTTTRPWNSVSATEDGSKVLLLDNNFYYSPARVSLDYGVNFSNSTTIPPFAVTSTSWVQIKQSPDGQYVYLRYIETLATHIYRSDDYGVTFQEMINFPTGFTYRTDQLLMNRDNTFLFITYTDSRNPVYSLDKGDTWVTTYNARGCRSISLNF